MAFVKLFQVTAGSSDGGNVTTAAGDTSGCDFFVAVFSNYTPSGNASIVSEGGASANTWTYLTTYPHDAMHTRIGYTTNYPANTNGSHTFTAGNGAGSYPSVTIYGFSGVRASSPLDPGKDTGAYNVGSVQPGSLTPSEDGCLLVTGVAWADDPATTVSVSAPFSTPVTTAKGGTNMGVAGAYEIQTSATARNPTWTVTGSTHLVSALAVFRSTSGGGGPLFTIPGRSVLDYGAD